jgi:hypothetical protein
MAPGRFRRSAIVRRLFGVVGFALFGVASARCVAATSTPATGATSTSFIVPSRTANASHLGQSTPTASPVPSLPATLEALATDSSKTPGPPLLPSMDLNFQTQKLGPYFVGAFPNYLDSTPLVIADIDNDGSNEIVLGLLQVGQDHPAWAQSWAPNDFRRYPTVFRWRNGEYQSQVTPWVTKVPWPAELANIGHLFVADVDGDGRNEVVVGLSSPRTDLKDGLFVFRFDDVDAKYHSIYENDLTLPTSFALVPEPELSGLLISTSIRALSPDTAGLMNEIGLWQPSAPQTLKPVAQDAGDTLYVGGLPGLGCCYVLREQANDNPSVVFAYRWRAGQLETVLNPLPEDVNVKSVLVADLTGKGEFLLVLLKSDAACALYWPCSEPPQDFIEVFRFEGQSYSLVTRFPADPYGHSVVRMTAGDVDGDGADEIATSMGVVYKWTDQGIEYDQVLLRGEQDAVWVQWPDDDQSLDYSQLIAEIGDADNDGENEIVYLGQTKWYPRPGDEPIDQSSLFVAKHQLP